VPRPGWCLPTTAFAACKQHWLGQLGAVKITAPAAQSLIDTLKSQLAYILINRDGVAVQPGSRCYRRTWIRDGSLTCTALLQFGFTGEVRQFIEWFGGYLYPSGKVPCCVDKRGADPTPEHDSHGQFIYLCMEYYRHTGDIAFVAEHFGQMVKAVDYIDYLRSQRLTAQYADVTGGKHHLYGILPESISHEGYSAKPAHSYWDDIFALQGSESDALAACRLLKDATAAGPNLQSGAPIATAQFDRLSAIYEEFKQAYLASIKHSMQHHGIDFIPGAADLGDSDATSVTVALDPGDVLMDALPSEVERTFEHYWQYFCKRRDGSDRTGLPIHPMSTASSVLLSDCIRLIERTLCSITLCRTGDRRALITGPRSSTATRCILALSAMRRMAGWARTLCGQCAVSLPMSTRVCLLSLAVSKISG
jgi:hypothetical protein